MATCNGKESWLLQTLSQPLSLSAHCKLESVDNQQTHAVYRLSDGARHFAVKLIQSINLSMNSREEQFALQQILANKGIAPQPLFLDQEKGIWVEQWSELPYWAHKHPVEHVLALALTRIHSTTIDQCVPTLDLKAEWLHYIDLANLRNNSKVMHTFNALQPLLNCHADRAYSVLCHHDLSMAHVATDEAGAILDWEYGAIGNRYFDIAAAVSANALSRQQQIVVAQKYAKLNGLSGQYVLKMIADFEPAVYFTSRLWEAARNELLGSLQSTLPL
ncbi:hypothetical protein DRW07_17250 [Alteromonas sediminis]|uniref:Aminoglycoside phosphotransferase domain-containing protein n=1 Tax=Alteromonas sediminis TaxID=2259342 RepID=A0A3N5XWK7_9ALTE|nr:phosphotransferase [Alteromonas sediminis]RPJ65062.1 hypothetical protein DRW07_17250 [Alteromonas sediminis]